MKKLLFLSLLALIRLSSCKQKGGSNTTVGEYFAPVAMWDDQQVFMDGVIKFIMGVDEGK